MTVEVDTKNIAFHASNDKEKLVALKTSKNERKLESPAVLWLATLLLSCFVVRKD